jgi:membrane protein DedA with SNARE-associated domain
MFDQIVNAITEYPYYGVALVFLLCGIGLPLPEEIGLLAAGYVCAKFPEHASLHWMMLWCAGSILAGDLIPFVLGRVFGVRLLRVRWLRYFVTKQRLAMFDRWFRRRGDLVIVIARFIAGLRVVAFFTAGTMKMPWRRFLLLDGLGIAVLVPLLTWIGFHSAGFIERAISTVQKVERGMLWGSIGGGVVVGLWLWLWQRRRQRRLHRRPAETFVEPQRPVVEAVPVAGAAAEHAPPADRARVAARAVVLAPRAPPRLSCRALFSAGPSLPANSPPCTYSGTSSPSSSRPAPSPTPSTCSGRSCGRTRVTRRCRRSPSPCRPAAGRSCTRSTSGWRSSSPSCSRCCASARRSSSSA